jgi:predicted HD phosphohydrolase
MPRSKLVVGGLKSWWNIFILHHTASPRTKQNRPKKPHPEYCQSLVSFMMPVRLHLATRRFVKHNKPAYRSALPS